MWWDGTWIKLIWNSHDLSRGEMRPVSRWDTNIGIQTEERRDLDWGEAHIRRPRGGWDAALMTWMEVRCSINGGDTCILGPLCIWIKFWMEVRHNLDGGESQMKVMKMRRWMKWEGTWIERRDSWDLNGGETWYRRRWEWDVPGTWMQVRWYMDGGETQVFCPGWGEMGLGWSWDAILGTWIRTWVEPRCDLNGDVTRILGLGWRLNVTWMEARHKFRNLYGVRWDLDAGEMQSWRLERMGDVTERWDENLGTCVQMRCYLDAGEMQILRYGWEWNGALMEVRHKPWDLDGMRWDLDEADMQFAECRWWWDVTWMVRHEYRDLAGDETWISGLGLWWDGTWMEVMCNCLDLDGSRDVTWMEMRRGYRDLDRSETGAS